MPLTLILLTLSFAVLAWYPPALHDFAPLYGYAGLGLAGMWAWRPSLLARADERREGGRPQLWLSGWVLLGGPLLLTAAFVSPGALGGLPWVGLGLLCFLSGQACLEEPGQRRSFIRLFSLLILAESLLGFWQAFVWLPSLPHQAQLDPVVQWIGNQARPAGTFINPNQLAAFLVLTLPLLSEFAFWEKSPGWKWCLRFGLFSGLVLLALTQSLAAIGLLLLVLCCSRPLFKKAFPGLPFAFLIVPLAALVIWVGWHRGLSAVTEGGKAAWLGRLPLWQPALEALKTSPWFGFGPGMTEEPYRQAQASLRTGNGAYPHSALLQVLLMSGWVGAAGAAVWLGLVLIRVFRGLGRARQGNFGLGIGILAWAFHSQVDINVHMPEAWLLAAAMTGGVLGPRGPEAGGRQGSQIGLAESALGLRPSASISFLASLLCLTLLYRGGLMDWQATTAILLAGLIACWHLWRGGALVPQDGLEWLACAGLAYLAAAISWSVNFRTSLETFSWLSGGLVVFMVLRRRLPGGTGWTFKLQAGAAFLLACVGGNLAWITLHNPPSGGGFHALVSGAVRPFFPNANLLGGLLLLILPLVLVQAWVHRKRIWSLALAAAIVFFLVASGSRGALAALLPALAWLGLRLWPRTEAAKKPALAVSFLVFLAILALAIFSLPGLSLVQRYREFAAGNGDPLFNFRPGIWSHAWAEWGRHFWLGWGPGTFAQVFEQVDFPAALTPANPLARHHYFAEYAHQEWLQWGLETGFVGIALALAWVGWACRKVLASAAGPVQVALEAGLVAVLAQSLVDFNLHCPAIFGWSMVWLALRLPLPKTPLIAAAVSPATGAVAWTSLGLAISMALCLALGNSQVVSLKAEPSEARALQGLALNPMDDRLWLDLADAQSIESMKPGQAAKLQHAMKAFQKSVRLGPRSYAAHAAYSGFLGTLSEVKSQEWLERLGATDGRWQEIRDSMGQQAAFLELALLEAEEAEKDRPFHYLIKLRKARLLLNAGLVEQAAETLNQVTDLEPHCARAWEWRARLAVRQQDPVKLAEALKRLAEIAKIEPVDRDPYELGLKEADWDWIRGVDASNHASL